MKMTEIKKCLKIDNFNPAWIIIIFTIVLFSCNSKVVFEDYHQLKGSEWPQDSILNFGIDITDSTKIYNLSLNVRNEGRYPYSNLWLFISIMQPTGKELKDTVELTLANPDGKWLGSGLGDLYEKKYPFKQNIFFPGKGNYSIKVRQGMRTEKEVLKGIRDFGICLEKAF